jgi:hypothetical protein
MEWRTRQRVFESLAGINHATERGNNGNLRPRDDPKVATPRAWRDDPALC